LSTFHLQFSYQVGIGRKLNCLTPHKKVEGGIHIAVCNTLTLAVREKC
jgi:hypothetical protein